MPSVSTFTARSTLAKNAVWAPRSGKLRLAMPACSKYRKVEVTENSSRNSEMLSR